MLKGGIPPFKKLNKNIVKINKSKTFNPDLLVSSLIVKKETNITTTNNDDDDDDDDEDD